MLVIFLLVGLLAVMVLMVAGGKQPAKPRAGRTLVIGDRLDPTHVCDERCTRPEAMCPYQVPPNGD